MSSDVDVAVVGAGAAGIFAAWRAAQLGARVVLVEKTNRVGTKILISGGGKCNVAHAGPLESVLAAFRPVEARFIRPACYRLNNEAIVDMMTARGLRVYTRPDGRVFPIDQTAKDVVAILVSYLNEVGVEVRLDSPVESVLAESGQVFGVQIGASNGSARLDPRLAAARFGAKALLAEVLATTTSGGSRAAYELRAKTVVIASGGSSYPKSGTTGDGWKWVRSLGHTVVEPTAALAPIALKQSDAELSGLPIRDCVLKARSGGKEIARAAGDLLFTHTGISGPAVLAISRVVAEALRSGEVSLEVDLTPAITPDVFGKVYLDWINTNPRRTVKSSLEQWMPNRMTSAACVAAEVSPDLICAKMDRPTRSRIVQAIKALPLGVVRAVPIEKGEVVAGGVALGEVDPKSMASSKVHGLYLCGEILDVAGPVGGYNLQAAFATGYVAGESAAQEALR